MSELAHRGSVRRAAVWGLVAAGALSLLLAVGPLRDALGEIGHMNPSWLLVAIGFELASCLSYVLLFGRLFEPARRKSVAKPAWIGLGAGSILPGGNVAGAAVSGVLLHRDGVSRRRLVEQSSVLVLAINAVSIAATALCAALLLSGAASGPHDLLRAGVPLFVCAAIAGVAIAIPFAARRSGERAPRWITRLGDAIEATARSLRDPDVRLLGALGYPLLDMGALWAACAATGHAPSVPALILAYNLGYLASAVPIPAGVGVLDGGLAAALILYGTSSTAALDAVLVYHVLAVWLPAIGGSTAWAFLSRERHGRPSRGAAAMKPSPVPTAALASQRA